MSSLSAKDRVSLCSFTFSDGRRCRTPRFRNNPRFCPYHAQKEARARAAQSLGKDLAYFFSGDYLSACNLSTALGRLIPAVLRGDIKPRAARTVAYLAQTLLQSIHISQHEYSYAFGDDGWRKSIRNSINSNHDYLFPPAPKPPQDQSSQPAAPQSEIPPAPAMSGTLSGPAPIPTVAHPVRGEAFPSPSSQPHSAQTPVNSHSACPDLVGERSAPSALRTNLRSEGSHPSPATPPAPSAAPTPQPAFPGQGRKVNPREPDRSAPWLSPGRPISPDSKLL